MNNSPTYKFLKHITQAMRMDVFGEFRQKTPIDKPTYVKSSEPLNDEIILAHLNNTRPLGCYLFTKELGAQGLVRIAVIDIDDKNKKLSWLELCSEAEKITIELSKSNLKVWPCRSGSGHGIHLWMIWEYPQSATIIRKKLSNCIENSKISSSCDLFPAQNSIGESGFGNLVALPFARKSCPIINLHTGEVHENLSTWNYFELPFSPPLPLEQSDSKINQNKIDNISSMPSLISEALNYIPAHEYDIWLRIGMALKFAVTQGHFPESVGIKLWEEWSLKDPKYNSRKQNSTWESLEPNGTLTLATIWHLAKDNGWEKDLFSITRNNDDHLVLARKIIDVIGRDNFLTTNTHVWRWKDTGLWSAIPDRELKQLVQQKLDGKVRKITKGLVESVADILKSEAYSENHEWDIGHDTVNFLNGELHLVDGLWELRPHSRTHYRTTQIPHSYDPTAQCPLFRKFLSEIFQNDADAADKIILIFELLGYTLMSNAQLEKFIILIGSGANGKSVLLDLIMRMVGLNNVTAVQPSQFSQKFQRGHLHLKLANLVTEIAEGAEIADAELKAIVSGELITAEHKFQHPFSFRPFCTCWFGTNHMPHTRDFSDALFRRAVVITFNRVFKYGVDADPKLKVKLANEIPGIIKFSLEAFAKVLKRGTFIEPISSIKAKKEWRVEADQVAQFVEDACIMELDASTTSSELYIAYLQWTVESGIIKKLGRKNFTTRLARLGAVLSRGKGGTRIIRGIKLSNRIAKEIPIDF